MEGSRRHTTARLPMAPQGVGQADGSGRFSFPGRGGGDRRHQDQLPGRSVVKPVEEIERYLGFVFSVEFQVVVGDSQTGGDFRHGAHLSTNVRCRCRPEREQQRMP